MLSGRLRAGPFFLVDFHRVEVAHDNP